MNKFIGILIGLVLLLAPIYAWIVNFAEFGDAALLVLKGGIMWALLLIGAALVLVGLTSLKE